MIINFKTKPIIAMLHLKGDSEADGESHPNKESNRDGILNAYKTNLSKAEFCEIMMTLSEWCRTGTDAVPQDEAKAAFWRDIAEA